eukprot:MONOS_2392.1-p1 / transcript=MONOS_2392.1 / gene=MONOS_2392 / organism=Monocercomonoides_exilis_PA203 / gene_product=unspecified product / transcript_product=unspecified product / location=Mono_scaffold00049:60776-62512(-) / protein_length=579 / sequence_SO=supercontig / SO=protein_coding / is_pseudo=false
MISSFSKDLNTLLTKYKDEEKNYYCIVNILEEVAFKGAVCIGTDKVNMFRFSLEKEGILKNIQNQLIGLCNSSNDLNNPGILSLARAYGLLYKAVPLHRQLRNDVVELMLQFLQKCIEKECFDSIFLKTVVALECISEHPTHIRSMRSHNAIDVILSLLEYIQSHFIFEGHISTTGTESFLKEKIIDLPLVLYSCAQIICNVGNWDSCRLATIDGEVSLSSIFAASFSCLLKYDTESIVQAFVPEEQNEEWSNTHKSESTKSVEVTNEIKLLVTTHLFDMLQHLSNLPHPMQHILLSDQKFIQITLEIAAPRLFDEFPVGIKLSPLVLTNNKIRFSALSFLKKCIEKCKLHTLFQLLNLPEEEINKNEVVLKEENIEKINERSDESQEMETTQSSDDSCFEKEQEQEQDQDSEQEKEKNADEGLTVAALKPISEKRGRTTFGSYLPEGRREKNKKRIVFDNFYLPLMNISKQKGSSTEPELNLIERVLKITADRGDADLDEVWMSLMIVGTIFIRAIQGRRTEKVKPWRFVQRRVREIMEEEGMIDVCLMHLYSADDSVSAAVLNCLTGANVNVGQHF